MPRKAKEPEPFAGLSLDDLHDLAPGAVAASHLGQLVDEWPERKVRFTLSHPTLGDGAFQPLVRDALIEFADRDELGTFQASNGLTVVIEAATDASIALQAAQPQEVELSDRELIELGKEYGFSGHGGYLVSFAHALAKLVIARIALQADLQEREETPVFEEEDYDPTRTPQKVENLVSPALQAAQDAQNPLFASQGGPIVGHYDGMRFIPHGSQEAPAAHEQVIQEVQSARTALGGAPSLPFRHESREMQGETGVTGSDAAMLAVTLQSLQAELETLKNENIRLIRRIEELGGKPPKRDRAAYMRNYRKGKRTVNPDKMVRFLAGDSDTLV